MSIQASVDRAPITEAIVVFLISAMSTEASGTITARSACGSTMIRRFCENVNPIALAASAGMPFVYLGYWVPGSRKMAYKAGFGALEIHKGGVWQDIGRPEDQIFIRREVPITPSLSIFYFVDFTSQSC